MSDLPNRCEPKMYLVHGDEKGPFAYATLTDFSCGRGLLQIHSDWGTYSYYWGGMGDRNLATFLLDASPSYVEQKLSSNMHQMGMKKESFVRLTKFMAQCWPRLIDEFRKDL